MFKDKAATLVMQIVCDHDEYNDAIAMMEFVLKTVRREALEEAAKISSENEGCSCMEKIWALMDKEGL